jgi:DNA primase
MDPVADIKARLPIEVLVGQYCKLEKRGRTFKCLCPFHNDRKPSLLVSPDKGIAYCFACQKGGDIFNFYQLIEGVEFPQALRDLAERAGVALPDRPQVGPKKDEKDRMRDCLEEALRFYRAQLKQSPEALAYLQRRGMTDAEIDRLQLGVAPDSFTATYEHLLKAGFSRTEIVGCGTAAQKDLADQRPYDRFRHRLMIPIHDAQGRLIGFGGRTLGNDDAKYLNSPETALYRKAEVLFGLHHAREAMRATRTVILVEGYFDVFAAWRVGVENVVAVCGTALSEEHVRLLRRSVDRVVLCLDRDRAGREAAERAFLLLAAQDLPAQLVDLPEKDPGDLVLEQPDLLRQLLTDGGIPYLDAVLEEMRTLDLQDAQVRRAAMQRLLPLLRAQTSAVERERLVAQAAPLFHTVESALLADLQQLRATPGAHSPAPAAAPVSDAPACTRTELTLILFLFYPALRGELAQLIAPETGWGAVVHQRISAQADDAPLDVETLGLDEPELHRLKVLLLYWEEQGFREWTEGTARREIRRNCQHANRETLMAQRLPDVAKRLREATKEGRVGEAEQLRNHAAEVTKLARLVR